MAFQAFAVTWRLFVFALVLFDVAQALVSEAESLVRFMNEVTDAQGNLYNWGNSSQDPCEPYYNPWAGVTCRNISDSSNPDTSFPSVIGLDFSFFGISGSISAISKLVDLKNLEQLDLSYNSFSGQIPHEITELRSLWMLDLGNNQIDGTIPELPSSLSDVLLQNNLLAGDIVQTNVFNLSLDVLDLHGNGFTGNLPSKFNDTPFGLQIGYLDLSHNQFSGFLPSDLAYLLQLEYCDMSNNQFEGSIPEGPWDPEWSYYIDLSANKLTGRIPQDPQSFKNLISASYVNLSHNTLSGTVNLSSAGFIRYLDLSFNQLEGDVAISNGTARRLEILRLQTNRFSGNLNGILGGRIEFPKLRELALGDNKFGVGKLNSILPAHLAGNKFPLLQILNLSGSGVTGKFPSELFQNRTFPNMQILDLSNDLLTGTINVSLLQMPLLRELRLRNNSLQGTIDVGLSAVDDLRVLDLSHNFFQFNDSEMQAMFDMFTKLRELRLSTGRGHRLPTSVSNLSSLEILGLSNCGLIGGIPDQYSDLRSLKFLDLSYNRLNGSLPEGFGSMPELTELNVSYNDLTGEIPIFHFHNFDNTSFAGTRLCGSPLEDCKRPSSGLKTWEIVIIVVATVLVSGGSCLVFGWIWRRKVEAERHKQDEELISTLLDRDTTTTLMSLRELRRATDEFSEENQVGVGGFGTVYWGTLDDGTEVAIKKCKRDASSSEEKRMFLNEVKILSQVHHRHLVRLLGCCLTHKDALLVFEFVKNGTLDEHLRGRRGSKPLSWEKRIQIALQTADALNYLHSSANPPIYHLDVKSANILLDENIHAKVTDFGISKLLPAVDVTHVTAIQGIQGTLGYLDPEAIVSSLLTGKSDVYAFGVVLLELITAKSAVDRSRGEVASLVTWALRLIQSGRLEEIIDPTILETFRTPDGRDSIVELARLAERCLRFESVLRPSTKEALRDLLDIQKACITGT